MLRKIRILLAALLWAGITLLFLDFTGTLHRWLGWLAQIQLLPAILALNVGVVVALLLLTLLFGRVYCSIICPLGIFQDILGFFGRKSQKNRYSYSPAKKWLRLIVLIVFVVLLLSGLNAIASLIAPYSAYGRIVQNIFAPIYQWGNNLLAYLAERIDSYAFYETEVWLRGVPTFLIALITFVVIGLLAWRNGRTYCNTICPVGTVLGGLARYSLFKPVIDTEACKKCNLCARNCKSACIDVEHQAIDYSRCVACMDCIGICNKGAISYTHRRKAYAPRPGSEGIDRRKFLSLGALLTLTSVVKAQEKKVDGGLAVITDKKIPTRHTPIVPPGAQSLRNMASHCTGCQLCVSACPNGVLRPSDALSTLMQPHSSYERGYCRPECTKCSEVCPTGAIRLIDTAEKSATQIGHAVWIKENCIPLTVGDKCGNCARHCPTGAIAMVESVAGDRRAPKVPIINVEKCIGCGACENLCPARPFSAIYVEGHEQHRTI
ncbi:MAG: 4Fe-4S binding protein [Coprobacter sp.]|nr:4Fe-4S binding protein [Coprobacter sp.]